MMTETEQRILKHVAQEVENLLKHESSGHDWWHIVRVRKMAERLAHNEGGDSFICQLASLVHDLADEKFNPSQEAGLDRVHYLLKSHGLSEKTCQTVLEIIATMSFRAGTGSKMTSLEGQIVQDADRLDALGAIGIARTMAYSGHKGRLIHDPNCKPRENLTLEEYRKGQDTAIMHFHEKLLKLKDLMNTPSAKAIAEKRHAFMQTYLEIFSDEWEGLR